MNLKPKILITKNSIFIILILSLIQYSGCTKFVEIDAPYTKITDANVYATDATSIAVLTGIYVSINKPGTFTGPQGLSLFTGLSADELTLYSGVTDTRLLAYYTNALTSNSLQTSDKGTWATFYNNIFTCNAAIEGLTKSNSLTAAVKQQLLGEAKFMRAFFYFYLTNLYGDVPLAVSTDYTINKNLYRIEKDQVYQQIIADLTEAKSLLAPAYLGPNLLDNSEERIRPNNATASALLARVYLYHGNWSLAIKESSEVINNTILYGLESLNNVFLKNSREAIWQLQPIRTGYNTEDGLAFLIPATGPGYTHPAYLRPELLNNFEPEDQRKLDWVDSTIVTGIAYYYPYKYKISTLNAPVSEYLMVLRLGEQYLIRAEAKLKTGDIEGAKADLNVIRHRAGLVDTEATTISALETAILHERQVELFTEWGHRWLDLKRTNIVNTLMPLVTPQKGGIWQSTDQLYPIPFDEIKYNSNLTQNPGY
ncbi:RagB/SusD domain-containing protein [Chitinophaga rupis]|uniref:RagB/SusD domain-containing protein n=1 Tax=Chitinophaga rupis TaxID=573321 RepID=A0A1H7RU49_9BACT|nr:RagB/SusD family nutrient uptake outer membrane protein [Chitinophaga rupis]SEL63716.1 RagB/SusD domain-containing protein [Chitinophaga rupis]